MTRDGHDHGDHNHHRGSSSRALALALGITAALMVVEFAGGLLTGSLALLADAGHMLSDVAALGLSLVAVRIAARPPSQRKSFGYHRSEVLAALINGLSLLVIAVLIAVEALRRLSAPVEVEAGPMLLIAVAGLLANLASAWILSRGESVGLNQRGALLHVLSDALGSLAAIVAGAVILLTGWQPADPLLSLATSLLIVWGGWRLLTDTIHVLMEGVPSGLELAEVRAALEAVEGVHQVHDLHIWSVTSGLHAMSGHLQVEPGPTLSSPGPLLLRIQTLLSERFHIQHTTIQLEPLAFEDLGDMHLDCGANGCALVKGLSRDSENGLNGLGLDTKNNQ